MRLAISTLMGLILAAAAPAVGGPVILEETSRIVPPEIEYGFSDVGVAGDSVIASAISRDEYDVGRWALYAFERDSGGVWRFTQTLDRRSIGDLYLSPKVAMSGSSAVASLDYLRGYQRGESGWVGAPTQRMEWPVSDLEMDGNTLVAAVGNCSWSAQAMRRYPDGAWVNFGYLLGATTGCGDVYELEDADISGNRAIVFNSVSDIDGEQEARIYEVGASPPWTHVATLKNPKTNARFGPSLALEGSTALVSSDGFDGIHVFDRQTSGAWSHNGNIVFPDNILGATRLAFRNGLAVASYYSLDHRTGVAAVFQRQTNGQFKYVARLVPRKRSEVDAAGPYIDMSGRRIVLSGNGPAYVYDLPAVFSQPAPVQDDFESGNGGSWSTNAGSGFSVQIAGTTRIFRQSSVLGDARAVLPGVNWKDQAIEADIKPTAFSGTDRWFGLVARYTDQNNYYYLALRQSNVIEIKRKSNGVFSTLVWGHLPVMLNQTYRLRLQTIGNSIRAYVDGRLVTEVIDAALTHGSVGVMMYKTRADIDSVYVSPDHYTRYWETEFGQDTLHMWKQTKGTWQQGNRELIQTSLTGDGRILTGPLGEDQVVQARVRPEQFADGTGSRWFGLIARYEDEGNFYYVTLRSSNEISLRKLVNGQTVVLATAPLPVNLNRSYLLSLATVGTSIRVWVDGIQRLQAADTAHASGRFGFATYKTYAAFDDMVAYDP